MGRTCVASRRIPNKRNNDLNVSGQETKGMATKKTDRRRKSDKEDDSPRRRGGCGKL